MFLNSSCEKLCRKIRFNCALVQFLFDQGTSQSYNACNISVNWFCFFTVFSQLIRGLVRDKRSMIILLFLRIPLKFMYNFNYIVISRNQSNKSLEYVHFTKD